METICRKLGSLQIDDIFLIFFPENRFWDNLHEMFSEKNHHFVK